MEIRSEVEIVVLQTSWIWWLSMFSERWCQRVLQLKIFNRSWVSFVQNPDYYCFLCSNPSLRVAYIDDVEERDGNGTVQKVYYSVLVKAVDNLDQVIILWAPRKIRSLAQYTTYANWFSNPYKGNLSHKIAGYSKVGRRKAGKPESCCYLYTGRSSSGHWHESGKPWEIVFGYSSSIDLLNIFWQINCTNFCRIITWKKLSKCVTFWKNLMRIMEYDLLQFLVFVSIYLLEGLIITSSFFSSFSFFFGFG